MSDDSHDEVHGPTMLAATNMLKPPPPVIGSLNKEVALPRTIKLTTLAGVGAGAVLGFVVALLLVGTSIKALMYGPALGGMLGWLAVNFSPLRGESLAKWLGLRATNARKRRLVLDGRPVRLYVGIAPLRRTAAGTVRMLPGGVPVDAVVWDPRGFPAQEIPGAGELTAVTRPRRRLTASTTPSSQGIGPRKTKRARR